MMIASLRAFGEKYPCVSDVLMVNEHTIRTILEIVSRECAELYPHAIVKDLYLTKEFELDYSPLDLDKMLNWLSMQESFRCGYAHIELVKQEKGRELVQIILKNSQIVFVVADELFEDHNDLYGRFLRAIVTITKVLKLQSSQVNRNDYALLEFKPRWGGYHTGHFHLFHSSSLEGREVRHALKIEDVPVSEHKYGKGRYPIKDEEDGYFSIKLEESWEKPLSANARDYFLFEVIKDTKYESY